MLNNEKYKKKKPQLSLQLFFLAEDEGLDLHFCPQGKNKCSHQFLNWWQQHATGMLHLDRFESLAATKWITVHIRAGCAR